MAKFDEIINKIKVEPPPPQETETQETETETQETETQKTETEDKISISELFDTDLLSDLFNGAIDFIVVSGLLLFAKQKNVNITREELKLNDKAKQENKELLNKVIDKIKIPEKLIGTILLTIALLSKYYDSFKLIENSNKNEITGQNKKRQIDTKRNETNKSENKRNKQINGIKPPNYTENQRKAEKQAENKPKRKRGRPKGTKNKPHHNAGRPKQNI